jgi:uncharacterized 2Fe-2S/4Fe-4S cluster protein (DUF4445 family)
MKPSRIQLVHDVDVAPPSLKNNTGDAERVATALKPRLDDAPLVIDHHILQRLAPCIREAAFRLRCVVFREPDRWVLCGVLPATTARPVLGAAIDLGTSRVVVRLLDLADGKTAAEKVFDNPQGAVGPDILTRVHHCDQPGGLDRLNRLVIEGINTHIQTLCTAINAAATDVYALAVAGNTTMAHLFMGLTPRWIIREPYIPVTNRPGVFAAQSLGLAANPGGRVYIFPNIGSYFGGDLVAGVLYAGIHCREDTTLMVDVGTNAEVVLGNKNWLIGCAGAAGPALEGGVAKMGMMAEPGAIEEVTIDPAAQAFHLKTIGNQAPRGICGSGMIDLAAQLFLSGMIDIRGKLVPDRCGDRWRQEDGIPRLVLVPGSESASGEDLTLSQPDLDSLIRSKAAMYTILETLTTSVGVAFEDLAAIKVAGTFGAYIKPRSAIAIGMLPDLPLATYQPAGNSSLEGASLVLLSPESLPEIDLIQEKITYLELNVNQEFMNRFSAAKFLPHTNLDRFPSVKLPNPS